MNIILVIKDIKNCDDYYAEVNIKNKKNHKKIKTFAHIDLKPMPKKKSVFCNKGVGKKTHYEESKYVIGFNDCIDEILGEE